MIASIIRRLFMRLFQFLNLPDTYYLQGKYAYFNGATISPARNCDLLKVADDIQLHDAFINLWDVIIIEEGVVFGHQVMLLTGKHEFQGAHVNKKPYSRGGIVIKRGAWVASRAIILGGVTIGEGSMVGAGSVVTKSIPDNEFWAGNPAKFIRKVT